LHVCLRCLVTLTLRVLFGLPHTVVTVRSHVVYVGYRTLLRCYVTRCCCTVALHVRCYLRLTFVTICVDLRYRLFRLLLPVVVVRLLLAFALLRFVYLLFYDVPRCYVLRSRLRSHVFVAHTAFVVTTFRGCCYGCCWLLLRFTYMRLRLRLVVDLRLRCYVVVTLHFPFALPRLLVVVAFVCYGILWFRFAVRCLVTLRTLLDYVALRCVGLRDVILFVVAVVVSRLRLLPALFVPFVHGLPLWFVVTCVTFTVWRCLLRLLFYVWLVVFVVAFCCYVTRSVVLRYTYAVAVVVCITFVWLLRYTLLRCYVWLHVDALLFAFTFDLLVYVTFTLR